jgi:hypothetical protein
MPNANGQLTLQEQINAMAGQISDLQAMLESQVAAGGPSQIPSYPNKLIVPFTYILVFNNIAAGVPAQGQIVMAADSVFELMRIVAITSADLSTDYAPNNCSFQLTDGSTGQLLSSAAVPQALAVTRTYQYGNDEKYPIQFPALATVAVTCNNLLAVNLVQVTLGLRGYKIFNKGP